MRGGSDPLVLWAFPELNGPELSFNFHFNLRFHFNNPRWEIDSN